MVKGWSTSGQSLAVRERHDGAVASRSSAPLREDRKASRVLACRSPHRGGSQRLSASFRTGDRSAFVKGSRCSAT